MNAGKQLNNNRINTKIDEYQNKKMNGGRVGGKGEFSKQTRRDGNGKKVRFLF